MKKMISLLVVLVYCCICAPGQGICRESLYETLSDAKEVNIYVEPIKDSSEDKLTVDVLKTARKAIEGTLRLRMTINFNIVEEPEDADIILKCDIFESVWSDRDPIDTPSLYGAIADAAIENDYARVRAWVTVVKGPRKTLFKRPGRRPVLMQKEVMATHEQAEMTEEESAAIIAQDLADNIMKEFFSKSARARRRATHRSPIAL